MWRIEEIQQKISAFLERGRERERRENKNGWHRSRYAHPLSFLVVWGGIEPPTQGFSVLENVV
jgi:hypothetical protein